MAMISIVGYSDPVGAASPTGKTHVKLIDNWYFDYAQYK